MIKKKISNFSINQICDSGQCFRMTKLDDGSVEVIAKGGYLRVIQDESTDGDIVGFDCSEEEFNSYWKQYFDIDTSTDYTKIIQSIDKNDNYLINAADYGKGIRILNQDLWEMIISFIISQRNNIKRIRSCIKKLCEQFGEQVIVTDGEGNERIYFSFPTAEKLAMADIDEIKALGVGYRDVYIKKVAESVLRGDLDLELLARMNYKDAKEELLKLYGVGNKVADCICLFALHHVDAFPMDTHIISIVDKEYNGRFPFEKYNGYAGVLQQYMFYYDLQG